MKHVFALMLVVISIGCGAVDLRIGVGANTGGRLSTLTEPLYYSVRLKEAPLVSLQASLRKKSLDLGLGADLQGKRDMKLSSPSAEATVKDISCIPIYVTASYYLSTKSVLKPMLVAQLGISLNDQKSVQTDEDWYDKRQVEDGLFYGVGMGLQYNNLSFNILYRVNEVYVQTDRYHNGVLDYSYEHDENINQVNMTLGYRLKL